MVDRSAGGRRFARPPLIRPWAGRGDARDGTARGSWEEYKEAHPEDGWVLADNRREEITVVDPVSLDERAAAADACALRLATRIPILLDDVDDAVASAYGGWPDRLYLIGRDGNVAFQGEVGPFGFKPEELAQAIEAELG